MPWSPPPLHPRRTTSRQDDRPSASERGYDWDWHLLRTAWLRDHPLCVACGAVGRVTPAALVDHVRPITEGVDDPLRMDPSNLQSLCRPCHKGKTDVDQSGAIGRRVVVCGLPGAGKTTYVRELALPGDLVWDWDAVKATLGFGRDRRDESLDAMLGEALSGVIRHLQRTPHESAWIIVCDPQRARAIADQVRGSSVHLVVDEQERQRRLAARRA